jgi:hypothetical protein
VRMLNQPVWSKSWVARAGVHGESGPQISCRCGNSLSLDPPLEFR